MNTKLTSIKLLIPLYNKFKEVTVNSKMTLQKLVNRSMNRYVSDESYRNRIETYTDLTQSGSSF